MEDQQQYFERRTYGPDEHFEGEPITEESESVGNLLRGGQARHSPGKESHEGWSEGDMNQSRRGERGQTERGGSNRRPVEANLGRGASNQAGRGAAQRHRERNRGRGGTDQGGGGTNQGQTGSNSRRGSSDQSRRGGNESQSGGRSTRYGRRSRELSGARGTTLKNRQGTEDTDSDSGGFLSRWFGSDDQDTSDRGRGDRRAGDRDRGDHTESGHDVGEYARRSRDTPRHTNAQETTGTGASDRDDRHTTRRHAGTDEEGRTDRPDFGDIGPLGGQEARSEARQQGSGESERRRSREGGTGQGTDVTEQMLERETTSYSDRHDTGERRAGETPDRSGQRGFGSGKSERDEGSATHRGTDRHERGSGQGTQRGERGTDHGGRTSTAPETTGRGTTTSGERGSTDRAGQQSNRQHGTRRQSQSRHSNPSQGSQRGSHREEGLSGRVGGHFGNPPAGESPEEGGERQFGGERGLSERAHQFGSRHGHGSQRRERFGADRDEDDRSGETRGRDDR